MANDNGNPQGRAPRTIKINRFQIALNVLVQVVVFFAILLMVNYLAFNHFSAGTKAARTSTRSPKRRSTCWPRSRSR
jgi:hypothetical protein